MKISKLVAERTKDTPSDAKMRSHILMLRAGYMKQVANGIYTLTALGQKTALNIENIIRNEMNSLEGQEVKFPVVMPKELWDLSGRYSSIGSEMLRFVDRTNHPMLLGMTHEEAAVHLAKNWVTSYTQLPFMIYQIQTKFRDEPRSRAGLIRVREFVMKDAYSFHMTQSDLEDYYYKVHEAYERIYKKIGLKNFISVQSDSGMMGGKVAHEFMLLNENGEDRLFVCKNCGFRANQEVAECVFDENKKEDCLPLEEVFTGEAHDIEEVSNLLKADQKKCMKSVVYLKLSTKEPIVCFVRGDREINEVKLKNLLKDDISIYDTHGDDRFVAGNIGPKSFGDNIEVLFDISLKDLGNMIVGANKKDYHFKNYNLDRDFEGKINYVDISKIQVGDKCPHCKSTDIILSNGVEIGNIFQLGTKYTKSMNMLVKTNTGDEINPIMGCYGIGIGRNLACVIEENCDDNGICMPMSVAPYKVEIVPIRYDLKEISDVADNIYKSLEENNIETLIDDRDAMPGVKFSEADLIGMPIRIVVSPRTIKENMVEIKLRSSGETFMAKIEEVVGQITKTIQSSI